MPLKANQCFGGTCHLQLQAQQISHLLNASFLFGLSFNAEDGDNMFL
jgi:hypothetical protein